MTILKYRIGKLRCDLLLNFNLRENSSKEEFFKAFSLYNSTLSNYQNRYSSFIKRVFSNPALKKKYKDLLSESNKVINASVETAHQSGYISQNLKSLLNALYSERTLIFKHHNDYMFYYVFIRFLNFILDEKKIQPKKMKEELDHMEMYIRMITKHNDFIEIYKLSQIVYKEIVKDENKQ